MKSRPDPRALDQAIAWHLRLSHGEDVWTDFMHWLEADPSHNDVYEAVVDRDQELLGLLGQADFSACSETAEANKPEELPVVAALPGTTDRRPRSPFWQWGAIAACVVLGLPVAIRMLPPRNDLYAVATEAGESRTVALADGSEIRLNGDSRVMLDRHDPRTASLERGEARFSIEHDPASPFTVTVGKVRLVDIGTVFNVAHGDESIEVGVSEGAVRFEGFSRKVDLGPGDTLEARAGGKMIIEHRPPTAIGSWADGVLIYEAVPLSLVEKDLSRAIGVTLVLPAAVRKRSFTGVIQLDSGPDAVRNRLEELLGASITAKGSRWLVEVK